MGENSKISRSSILILMAIAAGLGTLLLLLLSRKLDEKQLDLPAELSFEEWVGFSLLASGYLIAALILWLSPNNLISDKIPDWIRVSCLGTIISLFLVIIYQSMWLGGSSLLTLEGWRSDGLLVLGQFIFSLLITNLTRYLFVKFQNP